MTLAAGPGPILATYRLQVHAGFPLSRARELVPYLARLGITHLHLSPVLRARSGSMPMRRLASWTSLDSTTGGVGKSQLGCSTAT